MTITGYRRRSGAIGARNHVLVLPSVICSTVVARAIAADEAVAITHQHGCAQVGDDAEHTAGVFAALGAHPNVGAALIVGLGCETAQGDRIAADIKHAGGEVAFVGIQAEGHAAAAVTRGRQVLAELRAEAARAARGEASYAEMTVGLDNPAAPFTQALAAVTSASGARLVLPEPGAPAGPMSHPDLAEAGAQVIVSWCGPGDGPVGFPICPVIAVAGDAELYDAMRDDFDLPGTAAMADEPAAAIWALAVDTFNGRPTAAERNDSADFALRRTARSM